MSTKTVTKRVALATVVALGAGVLSLVTVSSANAITNDGHNALAGSANQIATAGVLNIATLNSLTGSAVNSATTADASNQDYSVGLVNVGDIAGNASPIAGTTQTAILLSTGKLVVYGKADGTNAVSYNVTGGTLTGYNTAAVNSSGTSAVTPVTAAVSAVTITPNAGVTSMSVTAYTLSGAGSINTPTSGTLFGQVTVTIAASSLAGTASVTKSGIYYSSAASGDRGRSSDATTGTWKTNSPTNQYANIAILDAYGTSITSTTGLLTATATNGAYVHLDASTGAAGTQSSAFYTGASPDNTMLTVSAPSFAPLTTTVTIAYNGVTIGTKSFTFTGPITKVTLGAPVLIQPLNHSATTDKVATLTYADAAGNTIYQDATYYPANGFITDSASDVTAGIAVQPSSAATGYIDWTTGALAGSKSLIVDYVNTNGVIAKSNAITVSTADVANTYTAAYDKSTYHPGDIATLTITFKDSKGNLAADTSSPLAGANADMIAVGGGTISAAPSAATPSLGVKTYKILVGITDGAYNTVVNIKNPTTAFSSSQSAQIASFAVASGSTSLNDVLKGIVSLIASINKQIAALAKLVTKKK
jgi:trimeric autotransporter adhesin